jgi:hypothetical protein
MITAGLFNVLLFEIGNCLGKAFNNKGYSKYEYTGSESSSIDNPKRKGSDSVFINAKLRKGNIHIMPF